MDGNQERDMREIDNLIEKNKETIKKLEEARIICYDVGEMVSVNKSIIRITENMRKLLRIRMKLIKETNSYKTKTGAENGSE
ncbi:MAG: hypothetical protein PHI59_01680 [Candidatus Omnitrophica bacterium]|nr:hypothetical protein [Candidatus Omnitrophota bacterium]